MVTMSSLLLPIVLSAVGVFIASSVVHMVFTYHKLDYKKLPKEDAVRAAVQESAPAPGEYIVPYATSMKDLADPEMMKKYEEGPVGRFVIMPNGPMNMGKRLSIWFVLCLVISDFCAYIAGLSLPPGADYIKVFQIVGATAFMGYALGEPANSVWRGQPWSNTFRAVLDGLLYALVTAGVFGWLWPQA